MFPNITLFHHTFQSFSFHTWGILFRVFSTSGVFSPALAKLVKCTRKLFLSTVKSMSFWRKKKPWRSSSYLGRTKPSHLKPTLANFCASLLTSNLGIPVIVKEDLLCFSFRRTSAFSVPSWMIYLAGTKMLNAINFTYALSNGCVAQWIHLKGLWFNSWMVILFSLFS